MAGSMTDFEGPRPVNEGDYFQRPFLPLPKRDDCRYEVIGEGKRVIEQVKEYPQQRSHK